MTKPSYISFQTRPSLLSRAEVPVSSSPAPGKPSLLVLNRPGNALSMDKLVSKALDAEYVHQRFASYPKPEEGVPFDWAQFILNEFDPRFLPGHDLSRDKLRVVDEGLVTEEWINSVCASFSTPPAPEVEDSYNKLLDGLIVKLERQTSDYKQAFPEGYIEALCAHLRRVRKCHEVDFYEPGFEQERQQQYVESRRPAFISNYHGDRRFPDNVLWAFEDIKKCLGPESDPSDPAAQQELTAWIHCAVRAQYPHFRHYQFEASSSELCRAPRVFVSVTLNDFYRRAHNSSLGVLLSGDIRLLCSEIRKIDPTFTLDEAWEEPLAKAMASAQWRVGQDLSSVFFSPEWHSPKVAAAVEFYTQRYRDDYASRTILDEMDESFRFEKPIKEALGLRDLRIDRDPKKALVILESRTSADMNAHNVETFYLEKEEQEKWPKVCEGLNQAQIDQLLADMRYERDHRHKKVAAITTLIPQFLAYAYIASYGLRRPVNWHQSPNAADRHWRTLDKSTWPDWQTLIEPDDTEGLLDSLHNYICGWRMLDSKKLKVFGAEYNGYPRVTYAEDFGSDCSVLWRAIACEPSEEIRYKKKFITTCPSNRALLDFMVFLHDPLFKGLRQKRSSFTDKSRFTTFSTNPDEGDKLLHTTLRWSTLLSHFIRQVARNARKQGLSAEGQKAVVVYYALKLCDEVQRQEMQRTEATAEDRQADQAEQTVYQQFIEKHEKTFNQLNAFNPQDAASGTVEPDTSKLFKDLETQRFTALTEQVNRYSGPPKNVLSSLIFSIVQAVFLFFARFNLSDESRIQTLSGDKSSVPSIPAQTSVCVK